MKKLVTFLVIAALLFSVVPSTAFADNTATRGNITGKTVVYGLTSLLIWPGIGQYLNNCTPKKNWTHAIIGIIPPFRFFSGWDALVARKGGFWDGKI